MKIIQIRCSVWGAVRERVPLHNWDLKGGFEESYLASADARGCGPSCKNMTASGTATHAASNCVSERLRASCCYHLYILSLPPLLVFCMEISLRSVRLNSKVCRQEHIWILRAAFCWNPEARNSISPPWHVIEQILRLYHLNVISQGKYEYWMWILPTHVAWFSKTLRPMTRRHQIMAEFSRFRRFLVPLLWFWLSNCAWS